MKTFVVPLTKSPHPVGRIGSKKLQDWYRGVEKAVQIGAEALPDAEIVLIDNCQFQGALHNLQYYLWALKETCWQGKTRKYLECYETVGQINRATGIAHQEGAAIIFVSTWLHYPRVRWIARGMKATHCAVFGMPRPYEALTDIALWFIYPLIELCGLKKWFQSRTIERRRNGKF